MRQEEIIHRMLDFLKRGGSYRYNEIIEQSEGLTDIPKEECYTAIRTMKSDLFVEVDTQIIRVGEFIKITDLGIKIASNGGYLEYLRKQNEERDIPIIAAKSTIGFNTFMMWGYWLTTVIAASALGLSMWQYFSAREEKSNLEQSQSKIKQQQLEMQAQLDSIKKLYVPASSANNKPDTTKK